MVPPLRISCPMGARSTGACTVFVLFVIVSVVASIDGGSSNRRLGSKSRNAKARELSEDTCVPLLQPHIQKVRDPQSVLPENLRNLKNELNQSCNWDHTGSYCSLVRKSGAPFGSPSSMVVKLGLGCPS